VLDGLHAEHGGGRQHPRLAGQGHARRRRDGERDPADLDRARAQVRRNGRHVRDHAAGGVFSALERSIDGGRIRQFSADDLLALARAFEVPIGWFLTPPPRQEQVDVATPDHPKGMAPDVLLDAVLGTAETLAAWDDVLRVWPLFTSRVRVSADGSLQHLGRVDPDVHTRLDDLAAARARIAARRQFGDLDAAVEALDRVRELLGVLDHEAQGEDDPSSSQ
jgi:hypothetical protein